MADVGIEQRQVNQEALPGVRISANVNANTFGASIAKVGEDVGLGIYVKAKREADETAILDASTQLAQKSMEIHTTMLQKYLGKDANLAPEYIDQSMGQLTDQLAKGLSSDHQRHAFQAVAQHRTLALQQAAQTHMVEENTKYQDGVTQSALQASVDNARLNASTLPYLQALQTISTEKGQIEDTLRKQAQRDGTGGYVTGENAGPMDAVPNPSSHEFVNSLSPGEIDSGRLQQEVDQRGKGLYVEGARESQQVPVWKGTPIYDQRLAAAQSKLNSEVIKGLLYNGKSAEANAYYRGNKTEFTADDRDKIEKQLQENGDRVQAQMIARTLIDKKLDRGAALSAVYDMHLDPTVEGLVKEQVKSYHDDQATSLKQTHEQHYAEASDVIQKAIKSSRGMDVNPRLIMGEDKWLALTPSQQTSLNQQATEGTHPTDRPTDQNVWFKFRNVLKPEQIAALTPSQYRATYRDKFSNQQRDQADGYYNAAVAAYGKDASKQPVFTEMLSEKEQIASTWKKSGLVDPSIAFGKYTQDQEKLFATYEQGAAQWIAQEEAAKYNGKRKMTPQERQDSLNAYTAAQIKQHFIPGTLWGSNTVPTISMTEEQKKKEFVPYEKIDTGWLAKAKNYLSSQGKPVSKDKLERAFAQRQYPNSDAAVLAILNE